MTGPSSEAIIKALPRLPSVADDVYEEMVVPQEASATSTYWAPTYETTGSSLTEPVVIRVSRSDDVPGAPMTASDPHSLLTSMRHSFQRAEQSLYAELSRTPIATLNDVRWTFQAAGRGAQKRIAAWKKKHLSQQQDFIGDLSAPEPDWWDKKCHALPGGNVVVHEEDWGSIIAFTLRCAVHLVLTLGPVSDGVGYSSSDFLQELSNMSLNRSTSSTSVPTATCPVPEAMPSPPASSAPSPSSAVANKGYKFFSNLALAQQPDPDKDDVVWQESDTYAAVVTRKEVSRDSASLLSIRDMLRQRMPTELGASGTKTAPPSTPRSAWAKPDVRLSMEAAGGEVAGFPDTAESAGKFLQELEAVYFVEEPRAGSVKTDAASASSVSVSSLARRARVPASGASSAIDVSATQGSPTPISGQGGRSPPSLANTFTNSLNYALRFMSSGQSTPRGNGLSVKPHHGLLNAEGAAIDERPHIKYEAMAGKHFKISCTAYYAKQFDLLRKRCGVDDVFVKSLSRSSHWQVEGGKSRANFWKTRDDRFVIKTLVNAWNVADL